MKKQAVEAGRTKQSPRGSFKRSNPRSKILWRISKSFRDSRNKSWNKSKDKQKKGIKGDWKQRDPDRFNISKTQEKLVEYFLPRYTEFGDMGLPPRLEDDEIKTEEGEEYYNYVIRRYQETDGPDLPAGYERPDWMIDYRRSKKTAAAATARQESETPSE